MTGVRVSFIIAATLAAPVLTLGCRGAGVEAASRTRGGEPRPVKKAGLPDQQCAHGPANKPLDLHQPVEKLFGAVCEHRRKSFECDECRWEVGVARAPASVIQGGLLKLSGVGQQRVEAAIALTGTIRFDERRVSHLSPQMEGVVRKVHVSLGQRVTRGQALADVESVALGEAEGQYLETEAAVTLARRNYERQAELYQARIAAEKDYLQSRQELEIAEIKTRSAREKLHRLGRGVGGLAALGKSGPAARGRLTRRAPAAGTVLVLHAVPGELARPSESVAVIGDLSTLWLLADLYESDLKEVAEHAARGDLAAAVTVNGFPGETFAGTVDYVGPTMDEATRTVKVRIVVKNPAGKLRAGMFAQVRLYLPAGEQTVAVPRAAVLEDEGREFVFLHHHGDYYVRRPVTTGRTWNGWVEVKRGLAGGEQLVTEGGFLLKSDVLRSKMGAGCAD
jgi:cobalt-zinc-cadmium efflux system membrane fusion protein